MAALIIAGISVGAGLLTLFWAVQTWASVRRDEQRREKNQLASLYVNPFAIASEDIQSRIYNILELGGLCRLSGRHGDSAQVAYQTLHMIFRYFAWERTISQYGPYTHDDGVIAPIIAIREAFRAEVPNEPDPAPFRFLQAEQRAIADAMTGEPIEGPLGKEIRVITELELNSKLNKKCRPFDEIKTVASTIDAMIKAAEPGTNQPLWFQRLAVIQAHLVDLLAYLEKKEGFDLFIRGTRKRLEYQDYSDIATPIGLVSPRNRDVWGEFSLPVGRGLRKSIKRQWIKRKTKARSSSGR